MDARTRRPRSPARQAFTLVELLVVVTIIGILISITVTAAFWARNRARESNVIQELGQLNTVLASYAKQHGQLPPDFAGVNSSDSDVQRAARNAVIAHLAKRWPRYQLGSVSGDTSADRFVRFREDLRVATTVGTQFVDAYNLSPATALVFWLGGPTDLRTDASNPLLGFCADETNPLNSSGSRENSPFEFDRTRLLADASQGLMYLPATGTSSGDVVQPFIYFRSRQRSYVPLLSGADFQVWTSPEKDSGGNAVKVRPYYDQKRNVYFENDSYQILCPGLDGLWGEKFALPLDEGSGTFNGYEFDNLTSFLRGRLEDLSE